jgi:hypothetical protein
MADNKYMTHLEFNRELERLFSDDERMRYFFGMVWERMAQISMDMDTQSKLMVEFATQLSNFVELHGRTQEGLNKIIRGRLGGDAEVKSVLPAPPTNGKK